MSDALGSLLKRRMRSGALQNRIYGCRDDYMKRMLEEIDDDTDLDDLVFQTKPQAFEWLQLCMTKVDGDDFSKNFKQIEMLWVSDNEIPENQVIEANIKKVSKIKSYNLASSISGKPCIYMRENSCVCDVCLRGDILNCKETKCGEYKLFSLEKKKGKESS